MIRALSAIILRELVRMFRQRGRLVSAMVRPLIWLLVIGTGFQSLVGEAMGEDYHQFLVPGLLAMVLLFGAMLASLSLVYDKESGVMRMLVMAPFPHYWIVLSRTLSAAIAGLIQALLLLLILLPMGYVPQLPDIPLMITALVLAAFTCASLGMLIAVFSRTLDNFAVIMNFVIFPVFFLSGALYPLRKLPMEFVWLAQANPFTYAVDLLKHAMLGQPLGVMGADLGTVVDISVMLGFNLVALTIAALRFSHTPVIESLARVLSQGGRR